MCRIFSTSPKLVLVCWLRLCGAGAVHAVGPCWLALTPQRCADALWHVRARLCAAWLHSLILYCCLVLSVSKVKLALDSVAFRELIGKIAVRKEVGPPCMKTFSKYLDDEYVKMEIELKKAFDEFKYVSTTVDHVAVHMFVLQVRAIASIHPMAHKITAIVTDNDSNFVRAFQVYQLPEDFEDNEVTFTKIGDVLLNAADNDNDMISLPPHCRCALYKLNLISCIDVDEWLMATPETKAICRNTTTIFSKLQLKCINEREHQCLREYCAAMKLFTVALDILQGGNNCFHGTLLPTLETLMFKALELKKELQKRTYSTQHCLCNQGRKDQGKACLIAECRKHILEQAQQQGKTNQTQCHHSTGSTKEEELKSGATDIDTLNHFPMIKKISLKHNAATPSSVPGERLLSLRNLILSPKRNRLSDQKFEKLQLLRYNHLFEHLDAQELGKLIIATMID
uniref:Uncharacterized protein n=1 Tax=Echeneis naucrates TaxID=173247 RepID=A0A665TKZ6_ECHNA